MGLLGGLALFVYGMEKMSAALKAVAGERMRDLLGRLTHNRFLGVITGAFVTAVVQSSSVTTVLVVGFISAGLMSLPQSIGVIMGANIGTTITAQIFAFKVTELSLWLVAAGFGLSFLGSDRRWRQHGAGLMGLGLIFFGMGIMGDAMAPLRSYEPFLDLMARMENPALAILVGAVFTALVQSSSATTAIVIVMASQGLLSLPAGIGLALGANLGTCVTALLATLGRPRAALRAAVVHVLFNLFGVLLWLPFIDLLAHLVVQLTPAGAGAFASSATGTPRQIANAHSIFNVANTILFIGFSTPLARLVERLVPDRPLSSRPAVAARYLEPTLLSTPALALNAARLEILHLGEWVTSMLRASLPAILDGDRKVLATVEAMDETVDGLHGEVITYLGRLSRRELRTSETESLLQLMEAANSLESIGDIIETNLVNLGHERIDLQVQVSESTRRVLGEFHRAVAEALDEALRATADGDREAARQVLARKAGIQRLARGAAQHAARRLVVEEPRRLAAYTTETDIFQNLQRIYYFTKRAVRALLPEAQG